MWAPLAATATRNLPPRSAGAGAGIYNTTRQVGAVLGSAAVAAVIEARLAANLGAAGESMGGSSGAASGAATGAGLPSQIASGFASAMSEAMLLPPAVLLLGVIAVSFFVKPSAAGQRVVTSGALAPADQPVSGATAPGPAPAG
jgi:hypothetical protein